MKNKLFLILIPAFTGLGTVTLNAQDKQAPLGWSVEPVSMSKWNEPDGLVYKQAPGVNLGVTSFAPLSGSRTAFLSNASDEIVITGNASGKSLKRFPVLFAARDFAYDQGLFYVLNEREMAVYDEQGNGLAKYEVPVTYLGVERLTRYNGSTYLLLPSGNSVKIESLGHAVSPEESEGWITGTGLSVKTALNGGNSYRVKMISADGLQYDNSFTADKAVAGVYVIGSSGNEVYLDVQLFVSESPIQVERRVVTLEFKDRHVVAGTTSIKVPDCYYVLSNNDLQVSGSGQLLNMITAPQGVYLVSLSEVNAGKEKAYPASLISTRYHFNDHLIQLNEK